jgi:hypothetical protein
VSPTSTRRVRSGAPAGSVIRIWGHRTTDEDGLELVGLFLAACFPGCRRHYLEALVAYRVQARSPEGSERPELEKRSSRMAGMRSSAQGSRRTSAARRLLDVALGPPQRSRTAATAAGESLGDHCYASETWAPRRRTPMTTLVRTAARASNPRSAVRASSFARRRSGAVPPAGRSSGGMSGANGRSTRRRASSRVRTLAQRS